VALSGGPPPQVVIKFPPGDQYPQSAVISPFRWLPSGFTVVTTEFESLSKI
jgi:hypothetical protein